MHGSLGMRELAGRARTVIVRLLCAAASLRLTTLSLAWLALIVFWGILYQARVGLPEANARFFEAWIFYAGGLFPLPALRGALLVLGLNLPGPK